MQKHDTATWVRWVLGISCTLIVALSGYAIAQDRKVTTLEVQQQHTDQRVTEVLQRVENLLNKQEPVIDEMKVHMALDAKQTKK